MKIRPAELYRRTAERVNLESELVVSVGEVVFTELLECTQAPKKLAYELDHVGTFALRHRNFWNKHRRPGTAPYVLDFLNRFKDIPKLIEEFKEKKTLYKTVKREYKEKSREQGKGQS